jgi:hypothetical protein
MLVQSGRRKLLPMPNIALKPKLHRYARHMAQKACHVPGYALQFGLT